VPGPVPIVREEKMPGTWFYDLVYRFGAPWELGVRAELRALVEGGRLRPEPGDTAIDLGCGTGANTVFLAQSGWATTGVDFSPVATRKAAERAEEAGVSIDFVNGDLTAESIPGAEGPFDLLLDYGTLDDLSGESRQRMADLMTRLAAPGARCLLYGFYAAREELPLISFSGPSRLAAAIEPGEMEERFGAGWDVERLDEFASERLEAVFLMTRRSGPAG
jgi:SAM-dependent methyltransferase